MAGAFGGRQPKQNLEMPTELIEDGKVTPVIDRCYQFAEVPESIRCSGLGHAHGKAVVTV